MVLCTVGCIQTYSTILSWRSINQKDEVRCPSHTLFSRRPRPNQRHPPTTSTSSPPSYNSQPSLPPTPENNPRFDTHTHTHTHQSRRRALFPGVTDWPALGLTASHQYVILKMRTQPACTLPCICTQPTSSPPSCSASKKPGGRPPKRVHDDAVGRIRRAASKVPTGLQRKLIGGRELIFLTAAWCANENTVSCRYDASLLPILVSRRCVTELRAAKGAAL